MMKTDIPEFERFLSALMLNADVASSFFAWVVVLLFVLMPYLTILLWHKSRSKACSNSTDLKQVLFAQQDVDLISQLVNMQLRSTYNLDDDQARIDFTTLKLISLGVKAVEAGAAIDSSHPLVKDAINKTNYATRTINA